MKRIIVNADDFGINEVVTAEIERQLLEGRVSSTTVMANGTCLDEVKCFAANHSEVSFGVHLCLSEFNSLTQSDGLRCAGLTDEEGNFVHKAIFDLKNLSEDYVQKAIREELNAQIDVVGSLGFKISHADSHHHVHTIFILKDLFADILHKRGIEKVRLGGDFRTLRMRLHFQKWMRLRQLNSYYKKNFFVTNNFYGFAEFLDAGLPLKDGETVELMCHPGHPGSKFQAEVKRLENVLLPSDIKLISYNDLH